MPHIPTTGAEARPPQKTVLVTGAAGYIGFAVGRAFARAGWRVYGVIRRAEAADTLLAEEMTPVIGAVSADLGFVDELLARPATRPFDAVVSCTEQIPFDEHWAHLLALFTKVAAHARRLGAAKPLVLMSSGCKDYGMTARHGDPGLAPHTEDSPLDPPEIVATRTRCALRVFEHADLFDAAVLRPTPLYGYGGSYYAVIFEVLGERLREVAEAAAARGAGVSIEVPARADTVYHGCHVDDCADAYVALAAHPARADIAGQCFNISAHRYETVGDILAALEADYGLAEGTIVATAAAAAPEDTKLRGLEVILGYTQWVDSAKIRRLTGWTDRHALFSDNIHVHRLAYEAAVRAGDAGVARIRDRVAGGWGGHT